MNEEYIDEVKKAIESLRELKTNWDGYRDPPVDEGVIEGMLDFADRVFPLVTGLTIPYIVPGGGNVCGGTSAQFEWHVRGKKISLEIELEEGHRVHYLKWNHGNDNRLEEEEMFEMKDFDGIDRCVKLLDWFVLINE